MHHLHYTAHAPHKKLLKSKTRTAASMTEVADFWFT